MIVHALIIVRAATAMLMNAPVLAHFSRAIVLHNATSAMMVNGLASTTAMQEEFMSERVVHGMGRVRGSQGRQ